MSEPFEFDLTLYPDPVLRRVSEPVLAFDDELHRIVAGMFRRMEQSKGVGLAAPQVGLRKRILVLNPTGAPADDLVLVNPEIVARSGPVTLFDEGCLSFPGIFASIKRPERCTVKAFDRDGRPIEGEFDAFVARIIQHEHDHLDGILLVDRMSPADKLRHKAALDELVARYRASSKRQPASRP